MAAVVIKNTMIAVASEAEHCLLMMSVADPSGVIPSFAREPSPYAVVVGMSEVRPMQRSVCSRAGIQRGASRGTNAMSMAPKASMMPPKMATLRAPNLSVAMPAAGSNMSAAKAPGNNTMPASRAV